MSGGRRGCALGTPASVGLAWLDYFLRWLEGAANSGLRPSDTRPDGSTTAASDFVKASLRSPLQQTEAKNRLIRFHTQP